MSKFITNQNIEINLDLASLGDRILAFIIDALIIIVCLIAVFILISLVVNEYFTFALSLITIPFFFYSLLFEWFGNGQTPGKRIRNIRVVRSDGTAAGPAQYILRWLLRPIDFGIYGSIAVLSIIVTKNAQRLGDLVAGTLVVNYKNTSTSLEDYTPIVSPELSVEIQFPQVKQLSHGQIELIRKALIHRRDGFDTNAVEQMTEKVKTLLGIETQMPDVKFLYTIIKDYENLS